MCILTKFRILQPPKRWSEYTTSAKIEDLPVNHLIYMCNNPNILIILFSLNLHLNKEPYWIPCFSFILSKMSYISEISCSHNRTFTILFRILLTCATRKVTSCDTIWLGFLLQKSSTLLLLFTNIYWLACTIVVIFLLYWSMENFCMAWLDEDIV